MHKKKFLVLVVLFIILAEFKFVYLPGRNRLNSSNKLFSQKKSDRQMLETLCKEYTSKNNKGVDDSPRIAGKGFSLFSYAGNLIGKQQLERNVTGIQPLAAVEKEGYLIEKIRLSLKNISLKQLYDFLYEVEISENAVYINDFMMRRDKENPSSLNVEVILVAIKTVNSNPGME